MATSVYTATIYKKRDNSSTQYWSNTYHILSDAVGTVSESVLEHLVPGELASHSTAVLFKSVRVSDGDPLTDLFISTPLEERGTIGASGQLLPMFLAVEVELVPNYGRHGLKYFHSLLGEGDQDDGQWSESLITDIGDAMESAMVAMAGAGTPLCSPGGREYIDVRGVLSVCEHQFKRKWARRAP